MTVGIAEQQQRRQQQQTNGSSSTSLNLLPPIDLVSTPRLSSDSLLVEFEENLETATIKTAHKAVAAVAMPSPTRPSSQRSTGPASPRQVPPSSSSLPPHKRTLSEDSTHSSSVQEARRGSRTIPPPTPPPSFALPPTPSMSSPLINSNGQKASLDPAAVAAGAATSSSASSPSTRAGATSPVVGLGLGVHGIRSSPLAEKSVHPPPKFTGEWSQRRRHQRSYTRLSTFTERDEANEASPPSTPGSPTSSSDDPSDSSNPHTDRWSASSARSVSSMHSKEAIEHLAAGGDKDKGKAIDASRSRSGSESSVVAPAAAATATAVPSLPSSSERASTSSSTLLGHGITEGQGERLSQPLQDGASRPRETSSASSTPRRQPHLASKISSPLAAAIPLPSSPTPSQTRLRNLSGTRSGARDRAIETLLISGRLGDASQTLYGQTGSPIRTAADLSRQGSAASSRSSPRAASDPGVSTAAAASDANAKSSRPSSPRSVGPKAATLAEAIRVLAYLPHSEASSEDVREAGDDRSRDEEHALRYALRFALEAADRTARLLARSQKEKEHLERHYRTLQSNLLLTEAQLSLLQEEASLVRSSANRSPNAGRVQRKPVAPLSAQPRSSTSSPRSASTSVTVLPAVPPKDADSVDAESDAKADSEAIAPEAEATSPTSPAIAPAVASASVSAATAASPRLAGGVSIASLRRLRQQQQQEEKPVDQRYSPRQAAASVSEEPEQDDEPDSDDERLGIVRRPPPKEVSLADFLDASRMSRDEITQLSHRAALEAVPFEGKGGRMANDAATATTSHHQSELKKKTSKFLRSLSSMNRKGASGGSLGRSSRSAAAGAAGFGGAADVNAVEASTSSGAADGFGTFPRVSRSSSVTEPHHSSPGARRARLESVPDSVRDSILDAIEDDDVDAGDAPASRSSRRLTMQPRSAAPRERSAIATTQGMRVSLYSFLEEGPDRAHGSVDQSRVASTPANSMPHDAAARGLREDRVWLSDLAV
ncbi:uncharacterized protein PFL1_00299 [Pseudozyma flocculosa PF-1]|uniref:uncharacterized protein n=1 Tax=Pseudozyma flocculosa PF-1 TaxID=1277687 RepID=UPI0004560A3E|nr:uncharacterized protein PFL1_00299 [Pseudozyma flocculosa PF-1]EPQ32102.1 hypothetical protein PFL1_00299 [Pseudozyma flocculosa PF-1]